MLYFWNAAVNIISFLINIKIDKNKFANSEPPRPLKTYQYAGLFHQWPHSGMATVLGSVDQKKRHHINPVVHRGVVPIFLADTPIKSV